MEAISMKYWFKKEKKKEKKTKSFRIKKKTQTSTPFQSTVYLFIYFF